MSWWQSFSKWLKSSPDSDSQTTEDDPFDVPQRGDARGGGASLRREDSSESFGENFQQAKDLLAQLDDLDAVLKTRHTKRRTRRRRPAQQLPANNIVVNSNSSDGRGRAISTTTTTQPGSGMRFIPMPPGGAATPYEINGMQYDPVRMQWVGGKSLRLDGEEPSPAETSTSTSLRRSSPRGGARGLQLEDYVLDDNGEWLKKEYDDSPTDKERSQPRLFLIRYLNSTTSSKMGGDMRLVDGRWVKKEGRDEDDDIDMAAFGDEEELSKWAEADECLVDLKEFDLGADISALWKERQAKHSEEMGPWTQQEKDPKRFLLDGIRQMHIIRVVTQANSKERAKSAAQKPAMTARAVPRQVSGIPLKLEKYKEKGDAGNFALDLDLGDSGKQLSPRRREPRSDGEEGSRSDDEGGDDDDDDDDWGSDFGESPVVKKQQSVENMARSASLQGVEIGDDDDDDDEEEQQQHGEDEEQEEEEDDADMDLDELDDRIGGNGGGGGGGGKPRFLLAGVNSIGDDDDDDDGDDDDDEDFADLKEAPALLRNRTTAQEDEDDDDWAMSDDDADAAPTLSKPQKALKQQLRDLVVDDDEDGFEIGDDDDEDDDGAGKKGKDFKAKEEQANGRPFNRRREDSFNDRDEEDILMHNVGGIARSDARKQLHK